MHRRTFCKNALALSIAATIPGCGKTANEAGTSSLLAAVSSDGDEITISSSLVRDFGAALKGTLLQSTDGGYESARKVWNGMIDKRPALIAKCQNQADVTNAVRFANEQNLRLAV